LANNQHDKIESYLALKYGIHKQGGNYINSAGTVFWDSTVNAAWHNDVFGVGQDNASGLTQSQSNSAGTGSGDGTGQGGKGNIILSNWSSLANNNFYMIGHDANSLALVTTGLPAGSPAGLMRISRTWKTQVTGGGAGTVTLAFDATGVIRTDDLNNVRMIIGDATGKFASATVVTPSVSGNMVTFANVSIPAGATFTFTVPSTTTIAPGGSKAGLTFWIDGKNGMTNSGGNVSSWTDRAGFNTLAMNTTLPAYVNNAVNFNPVAQFNGTLGAQDLIGNTNIGMSEYYTVAAWNGAPTTNRGLVLSGKVPSLEDNIDYAMFYSAGGGTNIAMQYGYIMHGTQTTTVTPPASGIYNIWTGSSSGHVLNMNASPVPNNITASYQIQDSVFWNTPRIAGRPNGSAAARMNGWIAEVIAYNVNKANAGRINVESYLAVKYGLTKAENYVNSANTVIWDVTANAAYHHDVFGVERDDTTTLMQTQSNSMNTGSGDGTGQSGMGNIVLSNPSNLQNLGALIVGHDVNDFTLTSSNMPATLSTMGYQRVSRTWKVQETGTVGSVSLSFETTGISSLNGMPVVGMALIIDHSGNGDFTVGSPTVEVRMADSVSGNVATFKNVTFSPALFTVAASLTPLPVTLTSFAATKTGCNDATVSWTVSNAVNFKEFEIERSTDNINFTAVATVPYKADNKLQSGYSFRDADLKDGTYLYRLKMTDINGTYKMSPMAKVDISCGLAENIDVVPNPAQSYIYVSGINDEADVRIMDMNGRVVAEMANVNGGQHIDISSLSSGSYLVQIIRDGKIINTSKIVKE
jgi:large repetitive protein